MARRFDEVQTRMYTIVDHLGSVYASLLIEVGVVSHFDVGKYRLPCRGIVDKVTKARSIYDSEFESYAVFFNVSGDGLDIDGFRSFLRRVGDRFRRVQTSVEECVYERRLAEAAFA